MEILLKNNSTYQNLEQCFKSNNITESVQTYQGFVIGMLIKGFSSSDRLLTKYAIELLNDGQNFSGQVFANFTSLVIDSEQALREGNIRPFLLTQKDFEDRKKSNPEYNQDEFNKERLSAFSDFFNGLSLGLAPNKEEADRTFAEENQDMLLMLGEICKIDTESEFAEEDYQEVLNFAKNLILTLYETGQAMFR